MIEVESTGEDGNKGDKSRDSLSIRQSNASVASTISNSTIGGVGEREPLDLSCGLPDTELPDKPQGSSAPRALAVHPYGRQFVCGDKNGTLCLYDLETMTLTQKTQAHAAEILTLHYSPPMKQTEEGSWVVDFGYENNEDGIGDKDRLVLLASAGRDRLVHIYDASGPTYKPTSTLDNHSSSVTVAKFTSYGQRFLSCGGDGI
jgi:WD40 repeat protein